MQRVHLHLPPHLLAEVDGVIHETGESRSAYVRRAIRQLLNPPPAAQLDIPSDLLEAFDEVVERRGGTRLRGAVLTEAIRRFVVEEAREERRRAEREVVAKACPFPGGR